MGNREQVGLEVTAECIETLSRLVLLFGRLFSDLRPKLNTQLASWYSVIRLPDRFLPQTIKTHSFHQSFLHILP